ncbi:hypothetical protein M407DRAFT_31558 [Tulasnella calospora MUT 4182]|uniref:Uncharacterized protein n=1 Tax=Tulasnella calospora MUT 4182 TaxID=1051891 RepID=A0A0C3KBG6_9AGAM|nr:hypothetical protein M407DRAFT_31558 [Tulasnella calospora MUT 4182]
MRRGKKQGKKVLKTPQYSHENHLWGISSVAEEFEDRNVVETERKRTTAKLKFLVGRECFLLKRESGAKDGMLAILNTK